MRVTDLIAQDHRKVRELFQRIEATGERDADMRAELLDQLVEELEVHAQAEEAVFYPAARRVSRRIDDAEAGHMHLREVIATARELSPSSPEFPRGVLEMKRVVLSHVAEEEGGIFLDAARLGLDELERLGQAMQAKKEALKGAGERRAA